ncbi:HD domain-containing protein [Halobacillus salinarum]|uniref:HD domain-containing protein n=1 Tax=Halobacillus salinarum TaxID=2932257 RepID=A0ABY4EP35_9BACI|nr:HD domain-containing phosphohydrolase [Halobacillus salinarum]UOQ46221.1 HD domain-containing protein [Halobacillus salinarum]
MKTYTLEELSARVEKSPAIIEKWFEELEERLNHNIIINDKGEAQYFEKDLEIIYCISRKREERETFESIFKYLEKHFKPRSALKKEMSNEEENSLTEWGRDPESLFYEIAQDNEIIQIFKYHSLRVMFLSSALARRTGCYDEDLRIAALLHDIGKMGLSKNILLKSTKLSDLEYTIIQSHAHIGNTIVRKHLGLTRAARFVRDHHERWDGTGYPRRLLGDEISLQGRIIGICDTYDTMTIDQRNYKKNTLTQEEAFRELKKHSWTQFDGNLVSIFMDIMDEITIPEYMLKEI